MNKCCVIAAIGESSLHRKWINKSARFDLHLIVYDDSYEIFKSDSLYVTQAKGYKFTLIHDYLSNNQPIIDQYDYFFMPDDDILINTAGIHKLFRYMKKYNLDIAQPAVANSYYSHHQTLRFPGSKMRFTNFVEIMKPCFSKEALKKVLFTFNATKYGWGIDFHWGKIVEYRRMNMAIIDDIISEHTRPVRSKFHGELNDYLNRNNLSGEILTT
jgi:hypothetical protein